jgi:hypothetical protein
LTITASDSSFSLLLLLPLPLLRPSSPASPRSLPLLPNGSGGWLVWWSLLTPVLHGSYIPVTLNSAAIMVMAFSFFLFHMTWLGFHTPGQLTKIKELSCCCCCGIVDCCS